MKHPSVGIVGINAVHWEDSPAKIQKDIYDLFVGPFDSQKKGNYTINVYWVGKDYYGHQSEDYAGSFTISADELKKYKDYEEKYICVLGDFGYLFDDSFSEKKSTI